LFSLAASFFFGVSTNAQSVDLPLVEEAAFDTIIDGKNVSLYTISNGKIAAQITNYGGYIISLFAPDKNGEYANLVKHYDNIDKYPTANCGQVGPSLGRFANRIANAQFTLDGTTYNITKNSGQHVLHGGNKGFDHIVWDVVKVKKEALVLSCVLPDGTDGFPGTLTTTLTYSITKDNGLSIAYEATTDKPTVVNLSHHVYYNLNGDGNGDIMEHQLYINSDEITETDRSNIPTGKFIKVQGTAYDFKNPIAIGLRSASGGGFGQPVPEGKVRNFDNNFVLNHSDKNKVEVVATVYSPQSGRFLEVLNDKPGLQVYTGARTAIALESQNFPDAPNHDNFPSSVLRPGEKYRHTCIYRFSIK
jgi:aldose 1-epimerase